MKNVFISNLLPGNPEKILRKNGFNVNVYSNQKPLSKKELIINVRKSDAVISLLLDKFDKEVIDSLENCRVIANCAVGYNNIDVEYARSKNIIITNTPDILTDATADLNVSLILACARRLHEGELMMRTNKFKGWKPDLLLGIELKGKTVGIVGAGRIGQAVAKRMLSFGTKIIYTNRNRRNEFEEETGAKKVTLNNLLKTADIISVNVPLNNDTRHLLNNDNLKLLKSTAIIVNTSRGEVIEEKSLIKLLKNKKIFAAGFDVYEGEPVINPALRKLENVFLLPHLGSATIETRSSMSLLCAKNIMNVLNGKPPITPV